MTKNNDHLTFRDRILRLEAVIIHVMRPDLPESSLIKGYKNLKTLLDIRKRNADVTAPDDIAEATRLYTQALKNVALLHLRCHFDDGASEFHKLRTLNYQKAVELQPVIHSYLDEHFPKEESA